MRCLADENIPGAVVAALRAAGHDVISVGEQSPGMQDAEVLAWLVREERVLLTCDLDFGALSRSVDLPAACGIILIRLDAMPPLDIGHRLCAAIDARPDWAGRFSVVEAERVRTRPLAR
jgi:predicted nuclease of predicted toxin-antitoxin system